MIENSIFYPFTLGWLYIYIHTRPIYVHTYITLHHITLHHSTSRYETHCARTYIHTYPLYIHPILSLIKDDIKNYIAMIIPTFTSYIYIPHIALLVWPWQNLRPRHHRRGSRGATPRNLGDPQRLLSQRLLSIIVISMIWSSIYEKILSIVML